VIGDKSANTPTGEDQLLEFAKAVERHKQGRHALHLKLSLLSAENAGSFASRNTASFFHTVVKKDQGQLFRLSSGDMMFVSSTAPRTEIESLQQKITKFFDRDPHIINDPSQLIDDFDLTRDFSSFMQCCESLAEAAEADVVPLTAPSGANGFTKPANQQSNNVRSMLERAVETTQQPTELKPASLPRRLFFEDEEVKPISPADLDRLESNFRILDPTNLLMDLPVAAVVGDMPPHVIFSEKSIDYDGLQAAVLPSRNLQGDPNLFERLCCIIEQQLIKKLHLPPNQEALANSFPSNVKTVLSNHFIQFDRTHRRTSNVPLIIDIRLQDALVNMGNFLRMRERVRDAGYRVCLSGMTTFGFAAMDHSHRLADFIKVTAPDEHNTLDAQWEDHFHDSARKAGNNRMIFTRCDTAGDLEAGRALGFSLYQGKYINEMIMARQPAATPPAATQAAAPTY
jgi:hypothetical protein